MIDSIIQEIIEIYSWTVSAFIMIFITAIAVFYQKKFGVKTFYYIYFVPLIVLVIAAIHLFSFQTFRSEVIEFLGSLFSFLASFFLYRKMVGVK